MRVPMPSNEARTWQPLSLLGQFVLRSAPGIHSNQGELVRYYNAEMDRTREPNCDELFFQWLSLTLQQKSADLESFLTAEVVSEERRWLCRSEYRSSIPIAASSIDVQVFCCDLEVILALARAQRATRIPDAIPSCWRITEAIHAAVVNNGTVGLRLKEIANRLHVSEHYLGQVFQNIVGMSFRTFLRLLRLATAVELLRSHHKTVAEIALQVGHEHASNLTREFRSLFGVSPAQFRRRHSTAGPLRLRIEPHRLEPRASSVNRVTCK